MTARVRSDSRGCHWENAQARRLSWQKRIGEKTENLRRKTTAKELLPRCYGFQRITCKGEKSLAGNEVLVSGKYLCEIGCKFCLVKARNTWKEI